MKGNKFRILGIAVIVAILAVAYQAYSTETYRMGDHYTGQYHRPGCPKLKQTYGGGTRFESATAAELEGYAACKRCDAAGPDEPAK